MLRVAMQDSENTLKLKLEGRFSGQDAENTRTLVSRCGDGMALVVDLTELTFIDSTGEEVLSFFGRFGAEFVAQTSYSLDVCERLHLRLARAEARDASTSGASPKSSDRFLPSARHPQNEKV
jgi:hypothetical protein